MPTAKVASDKTPVKTFLPSFFADPAGVASRAGMQTGPRTKTPQALRLWDLMRRKDLSQKDLADQSGMQLRQIQRILNNGIGVGKRNAKRLSDRFGNSPLWWMGLEDQPTAVCEDRPAYGLGGLSEPEQDLIDRFRVLSERDSVAAGAVLFLISAACRDQEIQIALKVLGRLRSRTPRSTASADATPPRSLETMKSDDNAPRGT